MLKFSNRRYFLLQIILSNKTRSILDRKTLKARISFCRCKAPSGATASLHTASCQKDEAACFPANSLKDEEKYTNYNLCALNEFTSSLRH